LRALSQEERFWQYSGKLWLCFKVGRYGAGGENNYWEGKVIGLRSMSGKAHGGSATPSRL
jgi:hypothetical protein